MQRIVEGKPSPTELQIETERQAAEVQSRMVATRTARSEATKAGMQRAVEQGRILGRPSKANDTILAEYPQVVEMLGQGIGIREVSRLAGVARNTVRKVKAAMDNETIS